MSYSKIPVIILGGGYTGKVIYHQALNLNRPIFITSRSPELHLQDFPKNERIWFDLEMEQSWGNIPEYGDAIWTFPARPLDQVKKFIVEKRNNFRRLVVIGSTSSYIIESANEAASVDENSPVNMKDARVAGEEFLRRTLNAVILRSAGIYGPGRNPLDWIRKGRLKYFSKVLNLIHVEDLSSICLLALEKGTWAETYNISDGFPRLVSELIEKARFKWNKPIPHFSADLKTEKKVLNQKMIQHFNYILKFPDLFIALDKMDETISIDP